MDEIQYCYYCRRSTETKKGDCAVCKLSKTNDKSLKE